MNEDLGNCRDSREDFDTEEIECDIQTLDLCIYNFPKGGVETRCKEQMGRLLGQYSSLCFHE